MRVSEVFGVLFWVVALLHAMLISADGLRPAGRGFTGKIVRPVEWAGLGTLLLIHGQLCRMNDKTGSETLDLTRLMRELFPASGSPPNPPPGPPPVVHHPPPPPPPANQAGPFNFRQ